MTVASSRGNTVVSTGTGTWSSTTNAYDGAVDTNQNTYATWVNSGRNNTTDIIIGGYSFGAIGSSDTINSASVDLRYYLSSNTLIDYMEVSLLDSASTLIGSATEVTPRLTSVAEQTYTVGTPTYAQISAGLRVRVYTERSNNTTETTEYLDHADLNIDYTVSAATPEGTASGTYTFAGSATGETPEYPLIQLTDKFTTSIDTTLWMADAGIAISGAALHITPDATYPTLESADAWTLLNSSGAVEFVQMPNAGIAGFKYIQSNDYEVGFEYEQSSGNLYLREYTGTWDNTQITYSATDHRWLRLRSVGTTVYWDTSADGANWINRRSKTTAVPLSGGVIRILAGTSGTDLIVDNFNIPHGSTSGTYTWAGTATGATPVVSFDSVTETFDTKDTSFWTWEADAGVSGGQCHLALPDSGLCWIISQEPYDLTGSEIVLQVNQLPDFGTDGDYPWFGMLLEETSFGANNLQFRCQSQGGANPYYISGRQAYSGNTDSPSSPAFSYTTTNWWRIRESSGTVYWDYSGDGVNWTNLWSLVPDVDVSSLYIHFQGNTGNAGGSTNDIIFDNVNITLGSSSGTYTFANTSAVGQTPASIPSGSASGTYSFTNTQSTSTTTKSGSASGSYSFANTAATSESYPAATASGAYSFAATAATAVKNPEGTASNTYTFVGSASGQTTKSGSSSGTYTFAGSATGSTPSAGGPQVISVASGNGGSGNSTSWTHTVESDAEAILAWSVSFGFFGTFTATYDSNAMTYVGYLEYATNYRIYLFKYEDGVEGTLGSGSKTVQVTQPNGFNISGTSATIKNYASLGTISTNSGSDATIEDTISSNASELLLAIMATTSTRTLSNFSGTQEFNAVLNSWRIGVESQTGATSATVDADIDSSSNWGILTIPLTSPTVPSGSASGTYTFANTAAVGDDGIPKGTASGTYTFANTAATSEKVSEGTSSGTYSFAGRATNSPFGPARAKLDLGQDIIINASGDSTMFFSQWPRYMCLIMGEIWDATVIEYEYNFASDDYGDGQTRRTGSGPSTIHLYDSGVSTTSVSHHITYLAGNEMPNRPDIVFISLGVNNMNSPSGQSAIDAFLSQMNTYVANIDTKYNDVPIVATTENDMDFTYGNLPNVLEGWSQWEDSWVGSPTPFNPPLKQTTVSTARVWLLDTRQANPWSANTAFYTDQVHPTSTTGQKVADWYLNQMAQDLLSVALASGTWGFDNTAAIGDDGIPDGSASGTYNFNNTAAVGEKVSEGTSSGTYTFANTSAVGQTPASIPSGSASGTYSFVNTSAVGEIVAEGTSSGTYAFAGTANGEATKEGSASGAYSWAASATGHTPTVGGAEGTASGTYTFANTTATGFVTKEGTSSGTYNFDNTSAVGETAYAGTASGTYAFDNTNAVGEAIKYADGSGNYTFANTAANSETNKAGSASGTYNFQKTFAIGYTPVVGQNAGNGSGSYTFAGSATGEANYAGSASGTYTFAGSATGEKSSNATGSGTYEWTGSATGQTPTVGQKFGSASGTYTFDGNATGTATYSADTSGTYNFDNTQAIASVIHSATAVGAYGFVATSIIGFTPTVVVPEGNASGQYGWVANALSEKHSRGVASGSYNWAGVAFAVSYWGIGVLVLTDTGTASMVVLNTGQATMLLSDIAANSMELRDKWVT